MAEPIKLTRIPALKTVAEFRAHVTSLGIDLPCDDAIATGNTSPLAQPLAGEAINGKRMGNRYAIHPMEGWTAPPAAVLPRTSCGAGADSARAAPS